MTPNKVTALDAAMSCRLQIGGGRRSGSEFFR
jgi:hypothetical protein